MNGLLHAVSLLLTAWLFGGKVLFAVGFAAFLFKALPQDEARMRIRKAFPPFYLFVLTTAGIAASTLPTRHVLMPAINSATDNGQRKRFLRLHGLSVVITLAHIAAAAVVLLRSTGRAGCCKLNLTDYLA